MRGAEGHTLLCTAICEGPVPDGTRGVGRAHHFGDRGAGKVDKAGRHALRVPFDASHDVVRRPRGTARLHVVPSRVVRNRPFEVILLVGDDDVEPPSLAGTQSHAVMASRE